MKKIVLLAFFFIAHYASAQQVVSLDGENSRVLAKKINYYVTVQGYYQKIAPQGNDSLHTILIGSFDDQYTTENNHERVAVIIPEKIFRQIMAVNKYSLDGTAITVSGILRYRRRIFSIIVKKANRFKFTVFTDPPPVQ